MLDNYQSEFIRLAYDWSCKIKQNRRVVQSTACFFHRREFGSWSFKSCFDKQLKAAAEDFEEGPKMRLFCGMEEGLGKLVIIRDNTGNKMLYSKESLYKRALLGLKPLRARCLRAFSLSAQAHNSGMRQYIPATLERMATFNILALLLMLDALH